MNPWRKFPAAAAAPLWSPMAGTSTAVPNYGYACMPRMDWNSSNAFHGDVPAELAQSTADAGVKAADRCTVSKLRRRTHGKCQSSSLAHSLAMYRAPPRSHGAGNTEASS